MWHLTRRTLLAGAAVLAGDAALAQSAPPARVKGPLVWLDMDQKELDDAYDQSVYAPNQRQITGRYVTNSDTVRARIGAGAELGGGIHGKGVALAHHARDELRDAALPAPPAPRSQRTRT